MIKYRYAYCSCKRIFTKWGAIHELRPFFCFFFKLTNLVAMLPLGEFDIVLSWRTRKEGLWVELAEKRRLVRVLDYSRAQK